MKRIVSLGLLVFLVLAVAAPSAFGWGSATHAYISSLLRNPNSAVGLDYLYGSMAPDVFNYMFDYPVYLSYLQDQTHHHFLKVWRAACQGGEKMDALGFVSHNDTWGEDSTAHHRSRTLLPTEGYVITKAKALHEYLWANSPEYQGLEALGITYDIYIELCHEMVEAAGDIFVVRSALRPSKDLTNLLLRAYTEDLVVFAAGAGLPLSLEEAAGLIRAAEQAFRQSMIAYGTLLQEDEATIIGGMTASYNGMVQQYLAALGISLPPGSDMSPLIEAAVNVALSLIAPDYEREVLATKNYVAQQLRVRL
jgi:hypothetical protein